MSRHAISPLAAVLCACPVSADTVMDVHIGTRGNNKLPYRLSLPKNYASTADGYPLVIGLHRTSRQGNDHFFHDARE